MGSVDLFTTSTPPPLLFLILLPSLTIVSFDSRSSLSISSVLTTKSSSQLSCKLSGNPMPRLATSLAKHDGNNDYPGCDAVSSRNMPPLSINGD
ncbi:hypothetical protein B0H65DRAFT_263695 [Neurospora tetraspora]|uniref:Uncharacterized protein n=1 Tax=Neurospora tetraspora TaxID=94610 RepID=A0AAE0JBE8_9PEZI|nr:hypothetical protein B0H65DRAFT_263695 [Neurospora tetraspora]